MFTFIIEFHKQVFLWIHGIALAHPQIQPWVSIIANDIDNYVLVLAMLTFTYFVYTSRPGHTKKRIIFLSKEMVRILTAVSVSWGLSYVIKLITAQPRPFLRYPTEVFPLFEYGGFNSFPSGHATLFMALGIMMSLHHKRVGYIFIALGIVISFARVMSGIHFPVDILAGWLIGGLVSYFVYKKLIFRK